MRGHEEASGTKYVPQELMDLWAEKDPVDTYKRYLLKQNVLSPQQDEMWREEIKKELDDHITLIEEAAKRDHRIIGK
jgi:2-oxoisovalerate dehydrogenase E1 component